MLLSGEEVSRQLFQLKPKACCCSQVRSWNAQRRTSLPTDCEWPIPEGEGSHKFILIKITNPWYFLSAYNTKSPVCLHADLPTCKPADLSSKSQSFGKGQMIHFIWFWVEGVWEWDRQIILSPSLKIASYRKTVFSGDHKICKIVLVCETILASS